MRLPQPRGPVSQGLLESLLRDPHELPTGLAASLVDDGAGYDDAGVYDDDLQLTLFVCYELHYHGWDGVDDGWEWNPSLLALRAAAEERFERHLRSIVGPLAPVPPDAVPRTLVELASADEGPSLATYLHRHARLEQFREFVMHRSVYHLKEADPHTWAIPRLEGRPKAALVEIQIDEYGGGQPRRMHSELFRTTMRELELDTTYGAYLDAVPAITLATNNVMSLFGLHRRHRAALLGQLAAFELTSSLPNRRYGNGLRRLGGEPTATRFYDEHVEADAVHEQIAAHDLCGTFCAAHPSQARNVLFGAACGLALDRLFAAHLLTRWERADSSLRAEARA
jgi:hypothetical protein